MSQPSAIKRPRTKLWQFSIANLLVAITLAAVTCGAFRVDISLGVVVLHLMIAILITTVRTRAALAHHEELWDALARPDKYRRHETINLAFGSFGIALVALFFFYVGYGVVSIVALIAWDLEFSVRGPLHILLDGLLIVLAFGAGISSASWWLRGTWPKSYFTRSTPDPSAKSS
jgi:hypothetical protein